MFDPEIHHRRSIRWRGYDYSRSGMYYVTICAHEKQHLFGEVMDGEMHLSPAGRIVQQEWVKSARLRSEIELDEFIIMPNHLHGLVRIVGADGVRPPDSCGKVPRLAVTANAPGTQRGERRPPQITFPNAGPQITSNANGPDVYRGERRSPLPMHARSLASFVAGFKSAAASAINKMRATPGVPVWQRNYYERVVRDQREFEIIREYIATNPLRWVTDPEFT